MAEEQVGLGGEAVREPAPWTRIFAGFRVAADPKKLLLAAAGIFTMALGWWLLASFFWSLSGKEPEFQKYRDQVGEGKRFKDNAEAFKYFKQDLNNWNLMQRCAGPAPNQDALKADSADRSLARYTVADFSNDYEQYEAARAEVERIRKEIDRKSRVLKVETGDKRVFFVLDGIKAPLDVPEGVDAAKLKKEFDGQVTAQRLARAYAESSDNAIKLEGYTLRIPTGEQAEWQKFTSYVNTPRTIAQMKDELVERKTGNPEATRIALEVLRRDNERIFKPSGELATWPWFEYRGPNPYLVMTDPQSVAPSRDGAPVGRAEVMLRWLFDQVPVLLEPLVKFLSPVVYFLHPAAYFWTRFYLLLVILWTILVWSLFGGAITRMATVQVARPTERVGMVEAVRFAVSRYRAYVASQLLPFAFLAGLLFLLVIYGFLEVLLPVVGDVLIAGVGYPLVLVLGLVMAVVLIGLTGWPLMYSTIGAEGSDSFDAISRSYSYVYQGPWHYLWYAFVALAYGAALVFFVGLIGSLLVYMGKFGMSLPSGFWPSREPSYLYAYAPTSYGWRDLLLHQSPHAETKEMILNTGHVVMSQVIRPSYTLSATQSLGAAMVAFWLYLLFLMIIGFGYSYFWTASSIIYLLMRRKVDDTEMDEVHLEEDDIEAPSYTPAGAGATATPATPGRTTVPLNVVEGPPATATTVAAATAPPPTGAVPRPTDGAPPEAPHPQTATPVYPSAAPKTQLASEGETPGSSPTLPGGGS